MMLIAYMKVRALFQTGFFSHEVPVRNFCTPPANFAMQYGAVPPLLPSM